MQAEPRRIRSKLRCAVYTRKSTEEGLEQEFNSLDAQREACEAYIASQKAEGWLLLPDRYDDGGVSGGTLERPALKRLLADIEAGKVDIVVVYKIDRLSRSLMDFAKLVEVFDRNERHLRLGHPVVQHHHLMGRLTLNVLLSFAQFEREVIGERIRDKIAASRKKGMWMGGWCPLGYDVKDRKLVVNEAEADACPIDLQALRAISARRPSWSGNSPRRTSATATASLSQDRALQDAQQPDLPRRGCAQGERHIPASTRRSCRRGSGIALTPSWPNPRNGEPPTAGHRHRPCSRDCSSGGRPR